MNQQIYAQQLNKAQGLSLIKASAIGNIRILEKAEVLRLSRRNRLLEY